MLAQTEAGAAPRKLGLWMSTALVIGNMIGSGIFLSPSSLARVHPTFAALTLNPSPRAGEGLPIRLPFSLFGRRGWGDEGKLAKLGYTPLAPYGGLS
ncbi:MAG: hypothetical protein HC833_01785 [Leptolyngbyaceae cyanobacterium RM1_406_9]|nr:hypothetical protein [Leptolyngbyaceae cyanobacterium RM1_406_9]